MPLGQLARVGGGGSRRGGTARAGQAKTEGAAEGAAVGRPAAARRGRGAKVPAAPRAHLPAHQVWLTVCL